MPEHLRQTHFFQVLQKPHADLQRLVNLIEAEHSLNHKKGQMSFRLSRQFVLFLFDPSYASFLYFHWITKMSEADFEWAAVL